MISVVKKQESVLMWFPDTLPLVTLLFLFTFLISAILYTVPYISFSFTDKIEDSHHFYTLGSSTAKVSVPLPVVSRRMLPVTCKSTLNPNRLIQ